MPVDADKSKWRTPSADWTDQERMTVIMARLNELVIGIQLIGRPPPPQELLQELYLMQHTLGEDARFLEQHRERVLGGIRLDETSGRPPESMPTAPHALDDQDGWQPFTSGPIE